MSNRTQALLNSTVTSVSVNPLRQRCRHCSRLIADPTSNEVGLHPACRIERKMRQICDPRQLDLLWGDGRAVYSVHIDDGVVCIEDKVVCGASVTNDIVRVVDDLVAQGHPLDEMPIIYLDTDMIWDRIVIVDGKFARFQALAGRGKARALSKAKAKFRPR